MAGLFEVDGVKCVACGACVRDCAFRALKMEDGAPFYAMLFGLPAVRYARGVQRDSYARIDFRG